MQPIKPFVTPDELVATTRKAWLDASSRYLAALDEVEDAGAASRAAYAEFSAACDAAG